MRTEQEYKNLEAERDALAVWVQEMREALRTLVDDAEECLNEDDWMAMIVSLDAYHTASTCLEEVEGADDSAAILARRDQAIWLEAADVCKARSAALVETNRMVSGVVSADECEAALRARAAELEKAQ